MPDEADVREAVIGRYRAAKDTLREAVAAHPEARYGTWSGRQVLIHVVGWDREGAALLPGLAAGEPEPDYSDADAWNARFQERYGSLSDDELEREYAAAGDAFVAELRRLPRAAFEDGEPGDSWGRGLADHTLEHAAFFGDIGA